MPLSLSVLVDLGYALRVQKERHEAIIFFNLKTTVHARPEFPARLFNRR